MAIRQIEEDYEPVSSARMWVKVVFLVIVVASGMLFLSNGSFQNTNKQAYNNSKKPSIKPTAAYSLHDVQSQGVKLANSTAEKAQQSVGDVLGDMTDDVTEQVSEKVEEVASESSQMLIDYAYKNTVLQFIKQMLDSLPERQQSEFQQMMCVDPASQKEGITEGEEVIPVKEESSETSSEEAELEDTEEEIEEPASE